MVFRISDESPLVLTEASAHCNAAVYSDKDKYGIRLRAEPDHMVLGKRLKGAFKAVTASIKELTSEQLEAFQKTEPTLGSEQVKVSCLSNYRKMRRASSVCGEVNGRGQLGCGNFRFPITRMFEVRPIGGKKDMKGRDGSCKAWKKMAFPINEITVYYHCQPEGAYLASVIEAHTDFILATTKAPLLPFPVPKTASVIIEEKTQLKGSDLEVTIVKGSLLPQAPLNGPACAYVNLRVKVNNKEQEGVVLLENPRGDNRLDLDKLRKVCGSIFGINNSQLRFFCDRNGPSSPSAVPTTDTLLCPYVNLLLCNAQPAECQAGDVGTLLLVNPVGQNELDYSGLLSEAARVFGLRSRRLKLYLDQDLTNGLFETKWPITIKLNLSAGRCERAWWGVGVQNVTVVPKEATVVNSVAFWGCEVSVK
ncbi:hypothetical protein GOODEAATRI_014654 [Goodea atripinnis]|uniref:Isoleucine--tRNA ligase cytoplasmic ubiquitin-like domain-containing protein n=1 Tax=Goodea atripinnis TaxID=208336 RepID=A0ABV0NDY2_9TELE